MDSRNLFILVLYITCVVYVFFRAIKSVEDKVKITLDTESLNSQLAAQSLKELIGIQFGLAKQYKLEDLQKLSISIENKSEQHIIYVYWDRCSLTELDGQSRRVVRIVPGMTLDLFQFQVDSVIPSGKSIKENLTVENVLKRNSEAGELKIADHLFDLSKLKKGSNAQKQRHADFMARIIPLQFSLRLVVRIFDPSSGMNSDRTYSIACDFIVNKLSWLQSVSWKPKK